MSHLRAPVSRGDRREGGRHGRPVTHPVPALPDAHIRPQLLRLAVLPPLAVALSASAAVLFTVRATGARPDLILWSVLAAAVSVTVAGITVAAVAADRAARAVSERIGVLRRNTARGEADLRALVEALRRGEGVPQRKPRGGPPADADDFELLAADLSRAHDGAVHSVVQAAQLSSQAGSEQKLEVFVNLARRLQSLVHREISILDELENEIEDPDLLKGLFHVDHLATRIRRHAENLAVLGGAVSRRQWSNPVSMTEVLRSAIAEVEQYSRVKLVPPIAGELRGHAVADVIHLLAELVENATVFSAPQTQVLLRADLVTSGLAVEVEDRGLGLPVGEQRKMNALLSDPDQVNVARLLADGRIGLYVVSQLARRHGIDVRLRTNIYGGVQAVLVIPQALLGPSSRVAAGTQGAVHPGLGPGAPTATAVAAGATAAAVAAAAPGRADAGRPVDGSGERPAGGSDGRPVNGAGGPAVQGDGGGARVGSGSAGVPRGAADAVRARSAGAPDGGTTGRPFGRTDAPTVPAAGRRRHAQRDSTGATAAPAPLPVRGAHEERPNPAEAVPGIRAADRRAVEQQAGLVPTPRVGTVRGTMERPRLPRRRAQEHLVPQLRGGPTARPVPETFAGHDPSLMAAFQRGIGLAETQQQMESTQTPAEPPHMDAPITDTPHHERARTDPARTNRARTDVTHADAMHPHAMPSDGTHTDAARNDTTPTDMTHPDVSRMGVPRMDVPHIDAPPRDVPGVETVRPDVASAGPPRADPAAPAGPAVPAVHAVISDPSDRRDGSTPTG
ncbi:ATP-binding protein [Streptomyces sp. NPDC006012]|uniref:ATP-binding protein n=1 Tax=Streptomyces sp. NPDC006012 TaxID=3364739 RepID=UPI0036985D41